MSVFKNLKGTIVGVQQDISASFKNLVIKKSADDVPVSHVDSGVNLDAGADLLNKFQTQWADLHDESEKNAQRAKDVDRNVSEIFLYLERQNDAAGQFLAELSTVPQLTQQLEDIITKLGQISGEFAELNNKLLELEDVVETHEFQNNKQRNTQQLQLYKQKKDVELEIVKVKLAKGHAEKSQLHETKLQEILMVRQKAFEEAYDEEIQKYKLYGQTEFKKSPSEEKQVELADITIDEDPDALDDFLNSADNVAAAELPPESLQTTDLKPDEANALSDEANALSDPAESGDFSAPDDPAAEELCAKVEIMEDEDYEEKRGGSTVLANHQDQQEAAEGHKDKATDVDHSTKETVPSSDDEPKKDSNVEQACESQNEQSETKVTEPDQDPAVVSADVAAATDEVKQS